MDKRVKNTNAHFNHVQKLWGISNDYKLVQGIHLHWGPVLWSFDDFCLVNVVEQLLRVAGDFRRVNAHVTLL